VEEQCRRAMDESWAAPPMWDYLQIASRRARLLTLALQTDALGETHEVNGEPVLAPYERPEFWGWLSTMIKPQERRRLDEQKEVEALSQLSHPERSIIQQMYESGDKISEPGTKKDILINAGYPRAEKSWKLLRSLGIVGARKGKNGGSFLTKFGLSIAIKLVQEDCN